MTSQSRNSLTFHRIIEAFKFGFAWRSRLGDPAFNVGMNEVRNMLTTNLVFLCKLGKYAKVCDHALEL